MPKSSINFRILLVLTICAALIFLLGSSRDERYIRLHIVANSNSYADQQLKENIRDELIASIGAKFTSKDSFDTIRHTIVKNLDMIEEISEKVSNKENFKYDVVAKFGEFEFPGVQYNDLLLPAGKYQALKVIIGKGDGSNWWCVMYPPLCITDSTSGTAVKNTGKLNQASVRLVEQKPVEHRLRIAQWFRRSRSRLIGLFSSTERIRER